MKAKKVLEGIVIVSTIVGAEEIVRGAPVEVFSAGDGLTFVHYFGFEHIEGAHERFVPVEDNELLGGMGKYIELSSSPYPFTQPLTDDVRNKGSTLPIDIRAVLKGKPTAENCSLYFNIIDPNDYQHRNLTVREVNPNNPDDPNNTNQIIDIMGLPLDVGFYRYDMQGTFSQNVARMFRVGVYTNPRGDANEDGKVDSNDLELITKDNWLKTTYDSNGNYIGNNYDPGDRNHDGWNDFLDFAIMGEDWLTNGEGQPISKLSTDSHERQFQLESYRNFYGDKVQQVRVARLVVLPNDGSRSPYFRGGVIPEPAATKEDSEPQEPKNLHLNLKKQAGIIIRKQPRVNKTVKFIHELSPHSE